MNHDVYTNKYKKVLNCYDTLSGCSCELPGVSVSAADLG